MMRLKKNIATSEEGFIFNPGTGDSFSTNPIGTDIIKIFKDGKTVEDVIEIICTKYDVDQKQIEKDLDDFISQLKGYNILD